MQYSKSVRINIEIYTSYIEYSYTYSIFQVGTYKLEHIVYYTYMYTTPTNQPCYSKNLCENHVTEIDCI